MSAMCNQTNVKVLLDDQYFSVRCTLDCQTCLSPVQRDVRRKYWRLAHSRWKQYLVRNMLMLSVANAKAPQTDCTVHPLPHLFKEATHGGVVHGTAISEDNECTYWTTMGKYKGTYTYD